MVRASFVALLAGAFACSAPPAKCPPVSPPPSESPKPPAPVVDEDAIASGDLKLAVHARPFANLAYQLDCLAGAISCSRDAIHAFWDPGWTAEDALALASWKDVKGRYDVSAAVSGPRPPSLVPLPFADMDFAANLRVASLLASTSPEYRQLLRVLVQPDDADRLVTAAEHFWPRFEQDWKAHGEGVAVPFVSGLLRLFRAGELPAILSRALRFYAAPLPRGTVIDFDVVVLPTPSNHSSGEQIMSHGLIEVAPRDTPEDRMGVVCHELFHFFYRERSATQQAALLDRFATSGDPSWGLAYNLLDESVATALGNGVVDHAVNPPDYARRLAREKGFYNVHSIDATAKGLLSRTAEDPTKLVLDSPEIVTALLESAGVAVGPDPSPLEYLRSVAGASEVGWWPVTMKEITEKAHLNNLYLREPLEGADAVSFVTQYPALPVVLLVSRAHLGALGVYEGVLSKGTLTAIQREAKKPGAFAYSVRPKGRSWVFVIVGDSAVDARGAAERLFDSPHVPHLPNATVR